MTMELNLTTPSSSVEVYLKEMKWIADHDRVIKVEKPGEGNMNVVLRAITDQKSLILKQSKPFVQKYPTIPAPIERVVVEKQFYDALANFSSINQFLPSLIGFDPSNYILALEDLGTGVDFTFLYQKGHQITTKNLKEAVGFLSILHNLYFNQDAKEAFPKNFALRKLNHEHLFIYPFLAENGFDLDTIQPGLQALADPYQKDLEIKRTMTELGAIYLDNGNHLLHGDFYPGSWLMVDHKLMVIDPEFCYFGAAEYDLGILIAHLKMAKAPSMQIEQVRSWYEAPAHFDEQLLEQFIGMELMRRMIGLAQLPLDLTLSEKDYLLKEAYSLL